VLRDVDATSVDVATDGFFVLDTNGYYLGTYHETANVSVTTLEGVAVAGELKTFKGEINSFLGWQASAPLAAGTKLKVVAELSGIPEYSVQPLPDQVELHVVGAPTPLTADGLALTSWFDFGHGVGDDVACTSNGSSCSSPTLMVKGAEEMLHAVEPTWSGPKNANGFLLWEAHIEAAPAPEILGFSSTADLRRSEQDRSLGQFAFPKDAAKYCLTLVVQDLRTGVEVKHEQCAEPGPSTKVVHGSALLACDRPPTPALAEAWCKGHPESQLPECTGKPPTDPMPTDPTPTDPMPNVAPQLGDDVQNPNEAHTSSGCQIGFGSSGGSVAALFVSALALVGLRRRRAAR
jgi:hypothetical protein